MLAFSALRRVMALICSLAAVVSPTEKACSEVPAASVWLEAEIWLAPAASWLAPSSSCTTVCRRLSVIWPTWK